MEIGEQFTLKRHSYVLRGALVLSAVAVVAGCSSDKAEREFAVPKSLCGVPVPADTLSRLLPESGKKLDVEHEDDISKDLGDLCVVTVDGDMALAVDRERMNPGSSARAVMISQQKAWDHKSADDGAIVYTDMAAVSMIKCRGAGVETEDVSTYIKVLKPARPSEKTMESLIVDYTAAFKRQHPCRPDK